MREGLRDRLNAMRTDQLVEILKRRNSAEWREAVFPIVEELLHARGVASLPAPEPEDANERRARTMARGTRRRYLVGDSVWCGGSACLLLAFVDAVALVKGGRAEVPASGLWAYVAGMLLPVLNVYFVARELIAGRRKDAALGVILSVMAVIMAYSPPWGQFVGVPSHHDGGSTGSRGAGPSAARNSASAVVGDARTGSPLGQQPLGRPQNNEMHLTSAAPARNRGPRR